MVQSCLRYILLLFLLTFSGCNPSSNYKRKVVVAVSANMQFAMQPITESFLKETGVECELILGSSGKLSAQITQGAPYDVFVSADTIYPKEMYTSGKTVGKPRIYTEGKLVLWTLSNAFAPSLAILNSEHIEHIALANPKTAPYGAASVQILKQQPFYSAIEEKLVFGESIGQTNQFITSKSAEIGITSIAVVSSPEMKNMGHWVPLENKAYPSLLQSAVLLKKKKGVSKESKAFYNFLFSDKAQSILKEYGYSIPK
ncbi:MAG: molybdate ABC transporter substrate-binding protein [Bacteroidota bacterium]